MSIDDESKWVTKALYGQISALSQHVIELRSEVTVLQRSLKIERDSTSIIRRRTDMIERMLRGAPSEIIAELILKADAANK